VSTSQTTGSGSDLFSPLQDHGYWASALCGVTVYSPAFVCIRCAYKWSDSQVELTWMADYIQKWFIHLQTVTHPITNRAQVRWSKLVHYHKVTCYLSDSICNIELPLYTSFIYVMCMYHLLWHTFLCGSQFYLQTHHTCLYHVVCQKAPRLNEQLILN